MFKLESYITPLLMSYVDKYVKLNKNDFQLSLWGGDAVLGKLDLRLDVIEKALKLPISFKSGFIHELRIHVPWTRIYSEPVVITVNTIECIVRLKDVAGGGDDLESAGAQSDSGAKVVQPAARAVRSIQPVEPDENLPPGYLHSLINKILHNVNIVVNNLIVKFVEDDVVLSLNVKSAECYGVDGDWTRAFIELAAPELVLRRVLDFHDLTLCLDKRNADGKIESYQEPLLYRCSLAARMLMHYDSLHAKLPETLKINILCGRLDMSLTNVQLPMFHRLLDLCLALYYGTLEVPEDGVANAANQKAVPFKTPQGVETRTDDDEPPEEGWVSWMWSYVPAVLPESGEEDSAAGEEESESNDGTRISRKSATVMVFLMGFYITEASLVFKVYETVRGASRLSSAKHVAKPYLSWVLHHLCVEMKMRGNDFTDVQFGLKETKVSVCHQTAERSTVDDDTGRRKTDFVFFKGDVTIPLKLTYVTGSLFDPESPENNGSMSTYVFDAQEYIETYSESTAIDRFGIFWMSYLFTNENNKERTLIRFLVGASKLVVSAESAKRVKRVVDVFLNPEHEPYGRPPLEGGRADREPRSLSDEDLEKFSDTSLTVVYYLTILQPTVKIYDGDFHLLPPTNETVAQNHPRKNETKESNERTESSTVVDAAVVVQAEQIEMDITIPIYARQIAESGTNQAAPSNLLMNNCHMSMNLKLRKVEVNLTTITNQVRSIDLSSSSSFLCNIVQPSTVSFSKRTLLFPRHWRNLLQPLTDSRLGLDTITMNTTKAQLLLLVAVIDSWLREVPPTNRVVVRSLVNDVFACNRGKTSYQPVVELSMSNLFLRHVDTEAVHAFSVGVCTLQLMLLCIDDGKELTIPLVSGPLDVSDVLSKKLFKSVVDSKNSSFDTTGNLLVCTIQIPKTTTTIQGPGVVYVRCRSLVGCFDRRLHDWLTYEPRRQQQSDDFVDEMTPSRVDSDVGLALDRSIAYATLPIKQQRSPFGSESEKSSINESGDSRASFRGSRVATPSSSSNRPSRTEETGKEVKSKAETDEVIGPEVLSWGERLSAWFPLIKILDVQIQMSNWCFFFPLQRLRLVDPGVDISDTIRYQFDRRTLPETVVVCLPSISVVSSGHRKLDHDHAELPVKSLEHSIAGDKLPWSVRLDGACVYTLHGSQVVWSLLKPVSIGATFAVITKYQMPPALEKLSNLGLCIHSDLEPVTLACSNQQFQISHRLLTEISRSTSIFFAGLRPVAGGDRTTSKAEEKCDEAILSIGESAANRASGHAKAVNSSSMLDSVGLTNDSELSRTTFSEETSSDVKGRDEALATTAEVKLTFWLQCTMNKLYVRLFDRSESKPDICLAAELEEITVAVDVQDVFSKVKVKLATITANHYCKRNNVWELGDHEGILAFCTHNSKQIGPVVYPRSLKSRQTNAMNDDDDATKAERGGSHVHGFLNLTYTQARTDDATTRLNTTFESCLNMNNKISGRSPHQSRAIAYLAELCLAVQPLTVVFNGPVFGAAASVFRLPSPSNVDVFPPTFEIEHPSRGDVAYSPALTSRNIPLLHVDVKDFSLLFPNIERRRGDVDVIDDVCFLHVGSVGVVPQPENPLPRLVVDRDVYRNALHARITTWPGSEVEDRQYQLDACAIEASSASWSDFVAYGKHVKKFTPSNDVQNPALEWNNTISSSGISDDVRVFPMVSAFDIKVVFAPAIVYDSTNEPNQVVCGYSLEVNVPSDLEILLTVDQARLLADVLESNLSAVSRSAVKNGTFEERSVADSTFAPLHDDEKTSAFGEWKKYTPFDVLLTAGKISVILYSHSAVTTMDLETSVRQIPRRNSFDSGVSTSTTTSSSAVYRCVPFLFVLLSQPHIIVTCGTANQKIEVSCYDVAVKGSRFVETNGAASSCVLSKPVPDYADFAVHWLETKPGRSDPVTGVLSSFCTFALSDYLSSEASIKVVVGRPLKFNVCSTRLRQISDFTRKMKEALNDADADAADVDDVGVMKEPETRVYRQTKGKDEILDLVENSSGLAFLNRVKLTSVQLVVFLETSGVAAAEATSPSLSFSSSSSSSGILLSASSVDADLQISRAQREAQLSRVVLDVRLNDVVLKTALDGRLALFLGPFSPSVGATLAWMRSASFPHWHRYIVAFASDNIQIQIDRQNLLLIEQMQQFWANVLQTDDDDVVHKKKHKSKSADNVFSSRSVLSSPAAIFDESFCDSSKPSIDSETYDDLKSEFFTYQSIESSSSLPNPGEITFCTDTATGQATMTWCYFEPRVITSLRSMQVPLGVPRHLYASPDESLKVTCVLQFSLSLGKTFHDYAQFYLSQDEACQAVLPPLDNVSGSGRAVAAELWRVQILAPTTDDVFSNDGQSDDRTVEPLVSPLTLAASLRVDSRFLTRLLPLVSFHSTVDRLQIRLFNRSSQSPKEMAVALSPYWIANGSANREVCVASLDNFALTMNLSGDSCCQLYSQAKATARCEVLEYRSLMLLTLLRESCLRLEIARKSSDKITSVQVNVHTNQIQMQVSQGIVKTLCDIVSTFQHLHSPRSSLIGGYVICNNTQQDLQFGQVGTSELIILQKRECYPYSWRNHNLKQNLKIGPKSVALSSCDELSLGKDGTFFATVEMESASKTTLFIKISHVNSGLKMVTVSGPLFFANRLDRTIQTKVSTRRDEFVIAIGPNDCSASFLVGPIDVRLVKLRIDESNVKNPWSQDVSLSDARLGVLVKLPLTNQTDYIHIWCHLISENHSSGFTENMIVFCPLFVVKSHLPSRLLMNVRTPKLKTSNRLAMIGRGNETQLNVGGRDLTHDITFQISSNANASSPALFLSSDTIEQVERLPSDDTDVANLISRWSSTDACKAWPYNELDSNVPSVTQQRNTSSGGKTFLRGGTNEPPQHSDNDDETDTEQTNIELQINLGQFRPGLKTLLIDVTPRWIVVNESGMEVLLLDCVVDKVFRVPSGKTIVPPVFQNFFKVGINVAGKIHTSDSLHLSTEDVVGVFHRTRGSLHPEDHALICLPVRSDDDRIRVQKYFFLTLHSTTKHRMRTVTIRERYRIVNRTSLDLHVFASTVSANSRRVSLPDLLSPSLCVKGAKKRGYDDDGEEVQETSEPLLVWNPLDDSKNEEEGLAYHLSFKRCDSTCTTSGERRRSDGDERRPWSRPVRLDASTTTTGSRSCVSVSYVVDDDDDRRRRRWTSRALVVTVRSESQVVYVVVNDDLHPSLELVNRCDLMLYVGQTPFPSAVGGVTVQEELEAIDDLPRVRPHSTLHYTLPIVNALFPDIHDRARSVRLHVGAKNDVGRVVWSQAIDVHVDQSLFVVIAKVVDVKVDVARIGHTVRVAMNPVSRAEVSAKEIRSRIRGKSVVMVESFGRSPPSGRPSSSACDVVGDSVTSAESVDEDDDGSSSTLTDFEFFCEEASFVLLEEKLTSSVPYEILCATLDGLAVSLRPAAADVTHRRSSDLVVARQTLSINVRGAQVDNPSFGAANYDFPVVLKALRDERGIRTTSSSRDANARFDRSIESLVSTTVELFQEPFSRTTAASAIRLSVRPLMIFVEDAYIWKLVDVLDKMSSAFSPVDVDSAKTSSSYGLPLVVRAAATGASTPVRMRHLCVEPVEIQISAHASLKMFISSDRAPLSFARFERRDVCTTSQQLIRSLVVHYASSALYRAGVVFGSLEILGNPTGLVRSIGSGVSDMICLPYAGLMKGPGPFISGFTRGMKSIAKHLSAGTLTSITNFASSVSRNMERLSMDDEHIQRNEVTRRRRPSGLSEGLVNGLDILGLSVLGAIAGVADQPLQTFTRPDVASSSNSDKARGVVSGIGKGIIGMVTKPIGGAAELLSQTSLGLLHGIGLTDMCQPRRRSGRLDSLMSDVKCGRARYHDKILCLPSNEEILICVDGCEMLTTKDATSRSSCALAVTSDYLFLIGEDEDELLCTLSLADIAFTRSDSTEDVLFVSSNRSGNEVDERNCRANCQATRVAAFVDDTTCSKNSSLYTVDDEQHLKHQMAAATQTKYELRLEKRMIGSLISWLSIVKNNTRKDRFSI